MNLKRLLCLFLAALMLVGVLAACGGDPKDTESDTETAAPAEEGNSSGDETGEEPATTPDDPKTEEPGTGAVTPDTDETEGPVESGDPGTETDQPKTETPSSSGGTTAKPPEPPKTTTPAKDPYDEITEDNTAQKAPNEDASLRLWFDHAFAKPAETNTTSTGRNTYKIYMGKNEIEDCQFYLSANSDKAGLSAEISAFKDRSGHTIPADLYFLVYFDVAGQRIADPIPPYKGDAFTVKANTSKGFLIKVKTTSSTAAGEYEATLNIKNSAGQIVKTAKVHLKVWNFTLNDASACKTAMDFSHWNLYATMGAHYDSKYFGGDDDVLYVKYYEYLVENRISPYFLPYGGGDIFDARNEKYMNNPRVTSFNILTSYGEGTPINASSVKRAYEKLSQKPEWLKKGYFYTKDEPTQLDHFDIIANHAKILKENFPGYRLIAPFFVNQNATVNGVKTDYIGILSDSITLWCPKTFCFMPYAEASKIKGKPVMMNRQQEVSFGYFTDRMAKEVAEGDELWWYVCWDPTTPYITFTIEYPGLAYRELFWQQKLYNVTGILYYLTNGWTGDSWNPNPIVNSYGETVYSDGQILYIGAKYGVDGPIGSLRLEAIRDGIEDYEYFAMLEKKIGKDKVNELISKITTSLVDYTDDEDLFARQRVYIGNYLEDKMK